MNYKNLLSLYNLIQSRKRPINPLKEYDENLNRWDLRNKNIPLINNFRESM